jgi:hypothetical protein
VRDAETTARDIVAMVGNISNRPDVTAVQNHQVVRILALIRAAQDEAWNEALSAFVTRLHTLALSGEKNVDINLEISSLKRGGG